MKSNDFVILKREILGVEPNSVGIIRKINDKQNIIYIFFIGKNIEIELPLEYIECLDVTKTENTISTKFAIFVIC